MIFFGMIQAETVRVDVQNDYLNSGFNPRVISLGNTGICSAHGSEAVYYNPALLMVQTSAALLLSYNSYLYDRGLMYGFYRLPLRYRQAVFGVGFIMNTISGIEYRIGRSESPDSIKSVSQQDIIIAMARELTPFLSFGMNLHFLSNTFSGKESMMYSAGFSYREFSPIQYALVVKFMENDAYTASVGLAWDLSFLRLYSVYEVQLAGEYSVAKIKTGLGYQWVENIVLNVGLDGESVSGGISYHLEKATLQYALTVNPLGTQHQVALEL